MKRAEVQAWIVAGVLAAAAVVLLIGGVLYGNDAAGAAAKGVVYEASITAGSLAFWTGALGAFGLGIAAALAAWGLRLARQQEELRGVPLLGVTPAAPVPGGLGGFRMSYGDDVPVSVQQAQTKEVRTLETGFQRMAVGMLGAGFLIMAVVAGYLLSMRLPALTPGRNVLPPTRINELAVVMALAALGAYVALFRLTRRTRSSGSFGEAVHSLLGVGLPGMAVTAGAILLGMWNAAYVAEASAVLWMGLLALLGMELIVNATRTYSSIEEFDQEPVDLLKLPLVPMLSSSWMDGLRQLLAQSLGLDRAEGTERGVMARMMPRVLVALAVLGSGATTMRVVGPGEVAILERLGEAQTEPDPAHPGEMRPALLGPGLHFTMPWPVDELVRIPVGHVQAVSVGTEDEQPIGDFFGVQGRVNFSYWNFRHGGDDEAAFVTGDIPAQVLGGFVRVLWRVKDPVAFYRHLSHSEFFERKGGRKTEEFRPIYEALINQAASRAVTQTFAVHPLDEILETNRLEVQADCQKKLQKDLDQLYQDAGGKWLSSGIEILELTITDVHPPKGVGFQPTATGVEMGPAAAYENIVRMREYRETLINQAHVYRTTELNKATGDAAKILAEAQMYAKRRVAAAQSDAARWGAVVKQYSANRTLSREWMEFRALDEVLPNATKIILGAGVEPPYLWQPGKSVPGMPQGAVPGGAPGTGQP